MSYKKRIAFEVSALNLSRILGAIQDEMDNCLREMGYWHGIVSREEKGARTHVLPEAVLARENVEYYRNRIHELSKVKQSMEQAWGRGEEC